MFFVEESTTCCDFDTFLGSLLMKGLPACFLCMYLLFRFFLQGLWNTFYASISSKKELPQLNIRKSLKQLSNSIMLRSITRLLLRAILKTCSDSTHHQFTTNGLFFEQEISENMLLAFIKLLHFSLYRVVRRSVYSGDTVGIRTIEAIFGTSPGHLYSLLVYWAHMFSEMWGLFKVFAANGTAMPSFIFMYKPLMPLEVAHKRETCSTTRL